MIQQSHFWVYTQKKGNYYLEKMCASKFIAALFTIDKRWTQPKCPSTDEWIKKISHTHAQGYVIHPLKRRKSCHLRQHGKWMKLEDVLSEISQTEQEKFCIISIICGISKSQIRRNREYKSCNQGQGGGGDGEMLVKINKS